MITKLKDKIKSFSARQLVIKDIIISFVYNGGSCSNSLSNINNDDDLTELLIEAISYGKNKDILRANIKKVITKMDDFFDVIDNRNNIYSHKLFIIDEITELDSELIVEYNIIV